MNARPSDPAGDLAAAELARQRLTATLRLPSWFHTSLGVAFATVVISFAYGFLGETLSQFLALVGGFALFVAVAIVQLRRFRRLNHVRIAGLYHWAVMGASAKSTMVIVAALGAAVWAGLESAWWLAGVASVAGGIGYAVCSRLWWEDYLRDLARQGGGPSLSTRLVWAGGGLVGMLALMFLR